MGFTAPRPTSCQTMVDAGVIKHLLAFYFALYNDTRGAPVGFDDALELAEPAGVLVTALVHAETGAADELQRAISGQEARDTFPALLLIQVRCCPAYMTGYLVRVLPLLPACEWCQTHDTP